MPEVEEDAMMTGQQRCFPLLLLLRLQKSRFWGLGILGLGLQKHKTKKKERKLAQRKKVGTQNMIHTNSEYSPIPLLLQFNMVSLLILLSSYSLHMN